MFDRRFARLGGLLRHRWWLLLGGLVLGVLLAQLVSPIEDGGSTALIVGLGGGSAVGLSAAVLLDRSLGRIRDASDLAVGCGVTVLAQLSRGAVQMGNPIVVSKPDSEEAHSYRRVAAAVLLAKADKHNSMRVLVTSVDLSSAHAMVSCNLSVALQEAGSKVALIAGDRRRNDIDAVFSLEQSAGLQQVLEGDQEVALIEVSPGLRVLSSGLRESHNFLSRDCDSLGREILSSLPSVDRLEAMISAVSEWADVVIIDSPPALTFADAQVFAARCERVVATVTAGVTATADVEQLCALMAVTGAPILGGVLLQRGELRAARSVRPRK